MEKVRIGNGLRVNFSVYRNGEPESFDGATNISTKIVNESYNKTIAHTYSIVDNVIQFNIDALELKQCGKCRVFISYTKVGDYTVDSPAFELVQYTEETGGTEVIGIEIVKINISGDIGINRDGASAYEVWEAYPGNEGKTIEQYFEWLHENPTKVDTSRTITAGNGLTGGGSLTEDRTIDINPADDSLTVTADNIKVNTNNTLTSTSTTQPLSANQGKVLNEKVVQVETDLNIKNAEQDASIKSIEQLLSQSNMNQTAQVSSSGREIVSLPKTASNGGMDIKLEGLTAQNLVVNGDFRNGTTGWNRVTITNGVAVNTILGGNLLDNYSSAIYSYFQFFNNKKYYFKTKARVTYAGAQSIQLHRNLGQPTNTTFVTNPVQNQWYQHSEIKQATADLSGPIAVLHAFPNDSALLGKTMEIAYLFVIDLTATFGAGNEPDLATCDAMFSTYFEGTKSFVPTGRVRSIGKNFFDKSRAKIGYFVSSGSGNLIVISTHLSSDYIRVNSNTTYTKSINGVVLSGTVAFYDANKVFISSISTSTFTTPLNTAYLRFDSPIVNFDVVKLEKGSVATPYEPYKSTKLYLTAPDLRSNGLVKDEVRKGLNGYEYVKRVGVGTLGAEKITNIADREFSSDTGFWNKLGNSTIANGKLSITNTSSGGEGISKGILTVGKFYKIVFDLISISNDFLYIYFGNQKITGTNKVGTFSWIAQCVGDISLRIYAAIAGQTIEIDNISLKELSYAEAIVATSTFTEYPTGIHYTLEKPIITPIEHAGILNSAESGTVFHEPVVADAGVYGTNISILNTTYPISSLEEIMVHTNVDTYLDVSKAVIASDGLSFTHPDLRAGDLVLFTYFFNKEKVNGLITATYYDGRYVIADTANGKFYKWGVKSTNGVATIQLTEV